MKNFDLYIEQGSNYTISLSLTDDNSQPIDLSDYSISGYVRNSYSDSGILIDLNPSITMPASGVILINVPSTGTMNLPTTVGIYDIEITNTNQTLKILKGFAYISPEVTY